MNIESFSESIDVLAAFSGGTITPRRLRWNGRLYTVDRVHSQWTHREGEQFEYYFSVQVEREDLFEICLHTPSMRWTLERVSLR